MRLPRTVEKPSADRGRPPTSRSHPRPLVVSELLEGGPAHASGLVRVGDALLAVGAADAQHMTADEAAALLEHWREPTVQMRLLRAQSVPAVSAS